MSQYNLPAREKPRQKPEGPQVAGFVTEAAENAPRLFKFLADSLEKAGKSQDEIFKQTGWSRDIDGAWRYEYGDQNMRRTTPEENPGFTIQTEDYSSALNKGAPGAQARQYEIPKTPMKGDDDGEVWSNGKVYGRKPGNYPLISMRPSHDIEGQADFADDMEGQDAGFWSFERDPRRRNKASEPTFGQMYSHPEQEFYSPELSDMPVRANYTFQGPGEAYEGTYGGHLKVRDTPHVQGSGSLGGIPVKNSLDNVLLHENIGHGGQHLYGRPWGGSQDAAGMDARGKAVKDQASQRYNQLSQWQADELNRLHQAGITGNNGNDTFDAFEAQYPNFYKWRDEYQKLGGGYYSNQGGPGSTVPDNYLGYRAEAGEADAANIERRARELSNRIPMTGEKPWNQFPNGPGDSNEAHWALGTMDDEARKPLQGDVHPFATLDMPPDLQRDMRFGYSGNTQVLREQSYQPKDFPGAFDWLFGSGGKLGMAGAAGAAGMAGAGEAEAADAKGDRVGAETRDEVQARRLGLAQALSASADQRATGGTGPEMPDTLSKLGLMRSAAGGIRNTAEGAAGTLGDLQEWSGKKERWAPTSQEIGKATDQFSPEWLQWLTRYKPQGPVEEGMQEVPGWWLPF